MILDWEEDEATFRLLEQWLLAYDRQTTSHSRVRTLTLWKLNITNEFLSQFLKVIFILFGNKNIRGGQSQTANELAKFLFGSPRRRVKGCSSNLRVQVPSLVAIPYHGDIPFYLGRQQETAD